MRRSRGTPNMGGRRVIRPGDEKLSPQEIEALKRTSVSPSEIIEHLDALNEEIEETYHDDSDFESSEPEAFMTEEDFARGLEDLVSGPAKTVESEPTVEEEEPEQKLKREILGLLGKHKNAPSAQQIAAWKNQHGQQGVYVTALGEGDVYVYTFLKRNQWQQLQQAMQVAAEKNIVQDVEERMKEKVLTYCVLWPRPLTTEFFYNSRAGVVDTLYQAILMNSYFLNPSQVMMLTTQL